MNQKITPSNVWNLDTIDTFTSEDTKIEDAGGLIANAALLYSSRVDDVASRTNKLLENFSIAVKKKKNLATLGDTNRDFADCEWADGVLRKILKGSITTQFDKDGYATFNSNSVSFFPCVDVNIDIRNKTICPWINKVELKEEIETEEQHNLYESQNTFFAGNDSVENEVNMEVQEDTIHTNEVCVPIIKKGWAGPTFWKLPKNKTKNVSVKKREKSVIDFTQHVDRNLLHQQSDNLLPITTIKERKKHVFVLPVDHKITFSDLYKFNTIDGSFKKHRTENLLDNHTEKTFEPTESITIENQNQTIVLAENEQEVVTDFGNIKSVEMARNLFKKCSVTQNKLDINKLKTDITNTIDHDDTISLSNLFKKVKYNHPEKNISIQYCIVGLLHLANEKNYKLTKNGESIVINKK